MKEKARIIRLEDGNAILQCLPVEGCKECAGNLYCKAKDQVFTAINPRSLALQAGDIVEYEIPTARTIGAGFMVLIFPLILFIALYYISDAVLKIESEAVRILIGLAGLGSGFGISYLGKRSGKQAMPEITAIGISPGTATPLSTDPVTDSH